VLARAPLLQVSWYMPTPSCAAPLKSSLGSSPAAAAASTNAFVSGLSLRASDTGSGPPAPCQSSTPRSLSSARLK
jgi:hypothetical protein